MKNVVPKIASQTPYKIMWWLLVIMQELLHSTLPVYLATAIANIMYSPRFSSWKNHCNPQIKNKIIVQYLVLLVYPNTHSPKTIKD